MAAHVQGIDSNFCRAGQEEVGDSRYRMCNLISAVVMFIKDAV